MVIHRKVLLAAGIFGALAVSVTHADFPGSMFKEALLGLRNPSNPFLFKDELPLPARITVPADSSEITMTLGSAQVQFHSSFAASPALGYNGSSPGPTIEVESGHPLRVHWVNALPAKHIFPAPAGQMALDGPDLRGVTHLHGAVVYQPSSRDRSRNSDGWPDLWTVTGEEQVADYPNNQSARTLFYHDHSIGETGRNVAAGLFGLYLIHDDYERSLNLPSGAYEIPLVFQAQGMNSDGSRYYTADITRDFYGNAIAVNGKLYPYLNVEPRKYRFRVVNASNARAYAFKLLNDGDHSDGPAIYQIGSDGGFLEKTAVFNEPGNAQSPRLQLTPGERADVIVDFSAFAGKTLVLSNTSLEPGEGEIPLDLAMQFRVAGAVREADTSSLPMTMRPLPRIPEAQATVTRQIVLGSMPMASGLPMMTLNNKTWTDPVTERPKLGSTEIWELVDTLPSRHPFHIHLVNFQVLDRRPFDKARYAQDGTIVYTGDAVPPGAGELGWKDVVRVDPGMVTRIIVPFGPYTGTYVYHCHNLEHEDMDMMRPFEIVP
jgi:spore coat protein A, manganese oxidase